MVTARSMTLRAGNRCSLMKRSAVVLSVLGLSAALVSCSSSTDPNPKLSASNACGGLSRSAATALEDITEVREFKYQASDSVPVLLEQALRNPTRKGGEYLTCEIFPQ